MRQSGVLLHITSLPSRGGIGTLGQAAYDFVDFVKDAGMTIWQVLPIGPTGYAESPYQSACTFAGNPGSHQQAGLRAREGPERRTAAQGLRDLL